MSQLTRVELINIIKSRLGAPVVEVELDDNEIGVLVDDAFKEVSRYITETRFVTIPFANCIDISNCPINTVVQIFRTQNPSRVGNFTDIYALSTLNTANMSTTNLLLSDYLYRTQVNQIKSTITTDLDFTFDKEGQKLYVSTFYPNPSKITLVYIPEFSDVSEVTEQYWINYIKRLSLARVKEAVGRVRSKYELSSSLYKLDGDRLVSEGIAEADAVISELNENSDICLPID